MATHRFGTSYDPAHFVEVPDPDYVDAGGTTKMKRPAAGTQLLARNADTLEALPNITTGDYGYWSFTTDDIPSIHVSGDGGATWVGPLISIDAQLAGLTQTNTAETALATAQNAQALVTDLQDAAGNPGGYATLDSQGNIPAVQLQNIATVVQAGDGSWPLRPASTSPLVWLMHVAGSQPPAGGGTTAGGGGMVPVYDRMVDVTGSYGA